MDLLLLSWFCPFLHMFGCLDSWFFILWCVSSHLYLAQNHLVRKSGNKLESSHSWWVTQCAPPWACVSWPAGHGAHSKANHTGHVTWSFWMFWGHITYIMNGLVCRNQLYILLLIFKTFENTWSICLPLPPWPLKYVLI